MKILYFDCFAGASGNMILAALVSLGVDKTELLTHLKKLNVAKFDIEYEVVDRSGISALHARVDIPDEKNHRHLSQIEKIIAESDLSESVKQRSILIFRRLAEAEAAVHGIEAKQVHFHEVGGLDAIVDIVGACIGFEILRIERFACSRIHVGSGFVNINHGKFPIPAPAVSQLLNSVPIYSTEIEGELITPTGAAIISTVCATYGAIPEILLEKTAYGAGTRNYAKFPNVLRIMIGTDSVATGSKMETVNVLETNIDDVSPQILGFVMERAFKLGALDVWFTPIQMKKNRPATQLSVLCKPERSAALSAMVYSETTTLGVRVVEMKRECLDRELVSVPTPFGEIDVKIAWLNGNVVNVMPEYEQVKAAALAHNVTFRAVHNVVVQKMQISTATKA